MFVLQMYINIVNYKNRFCVINFYSVLIRTRMYFTYFCIILLYTHTDTSDMVPLRKYIVYRTWKATFPKERPILDMTFNVAATTTDNQRRVYCYCVHVRTEKFFLKNIATNVTSVTYHLFHRVWLI
jgi:hypothetical protein